MWFSKKIPFSVSSKYIKQVLCVFIRIICFITFFINKYWQELTRGLDQVSNFGPLKWVWQPWCKRTELLSLFLKLSPAALWRELISAARFQDLQLYEAVNQKDSLSFTTTDWRQSPEVQFSLRPADRHVNKTPRHLTPPDSPLTQRRDFTYFWWRTQT